eukprot:CAMPEP_0172079954 /NCGR_PEP_ID=MMETSP1043-20130122/18456_1 /TAXON_ID=464988 /ORGANISM="Hemiselmis andersenii, Strain CCMP441" /LENGTH=48 /DNA_ID= /DNA_START= /DNA_END= /DNA_ORIENTATION=
MADTTQQQRDADRTKPPRVMMRKLPPKVGGGRGRGQAPGRGRGAVQGM